MKFQKTKRACMARDAVESGAHCITILVSRYLHHPALRALLFYSTIPFLSVITTNRRAIETPPLFW